MSQELKESPNGEIRTMLDYQLALARSILPNCGPDTDNIISGGVHHGRKDLSGIMRSIIRENEEKVWAWARQNPEMAMIPVKKKGGNSCL